MNAILEFFKNLGVTSFSMGVSDVIEILIIAFVIYKLIIWMKETRTWTILKGVLALGIFILLAEIFELNTILYIVEHSLDVIVLALIVVFQPELRSTLERIGKGRVMSSIFAGKSNPSEEGFTELVEDELIKASYSLGQARTGALIVIEREDNLDDYIKTGIKVDASISSPLLINIFEHNTPLHDGAVIVRGNRVVSATCYLPLSASSSISKSFGTRHRAALGLSEVSDAIIIVVSEETGHVSVAEGGELMDNLKVDDLRQILDTLLEKEQESRRSFAFWRRRKDERKDS
ncbi:MAG: diadenylate cyclase CdaA [Lachnospiraceae bacterium]|nr:diadenylate cyclase CdaA [Lachnospiraceae bacterium]